MSSLWQLTRRFITVLLMVSFPLLTLYPDQAAAMGAGSAFNSLLGNADTSTTTPGYYQTEARNAFVAGGFDVHFANNSFQLINITPPSFSAGCGGVSMFFGGFSFISGAQFSALVQNILQAAIGYAIQLAIQTLCPACEAVLQVLQKAAQMANSLANNTCQMAKDAVNEGASLLGLQGLGSDSSNGGSATTPGASSQCAKDQASSGNGSGFLSSINSGVCQFAASADAHLTSWMASLNGPAQSQQADKHADEFGNLTYESLRAAGVSSWEDIDILMSLIGTEVVAPPSSCVGNTSCPAATTSDKPLPFVGMSKNLKPLVLDYLCGSVNSAALDTDPSNESFCETMDGTTSSSVPENSAWSLLQNTPVYYCGGVASSPAVSWPSTDIPMMNGTMGDCTMVEKSTIEAVSSGEVSPTEQNSSGWSSFSQQGFLVYVTNTLDGAVNAVTNNQPLSPQVIQLIQKAPFPLYQVIDLAAVYPSTATQLINSASQTIALLLTEKLLINVMHNVMDASQISNINAKTISLAGAMNVLSSIREEQSKVTQRALNLNDYELQMMTEVRQIQRLIQDQVMQEGVMGNQQYSQALMSGITLGSGPNNQG
ncbi:hypothetical protein A6M27_16950 [Acidithiobacillus thiooxidans]|uniref:Conjugal transfer protein TraH n=1 Tax=Acidithiobacillus thiooxidans TaxID=930 RepID=A0A1C2I0B2_ACITH|nr:conjugal transfer protein TraH [Acidithiobacillus thiooxidans]OCX69429.1 hypothetical protein A6P07_16570 [Acidithiobacillus thiooxidans]OCX81056.1 hypothetical protein A6O26_13770 [Acidithiobacillus thiooxidans]OCX83782.1 hypothetical protein A6M27_16950 [Acidithiobacillus thiooxidans]OFC50268.1 hypothetical protein BAE47_02935 [Acidithiobacillus thiooxidans]